MTNILSAPMRWSSATAAAIRSRAMTPVVYALAIFLVTLVINLLSANDGLVPQLFPDSVTYTRVADQIALLDLPDFSVRTPGYPLLLLPQALTGLPYVTVLLQAVLGSIAAVLLWRILRVPLQSDAWSAVTTIVLMSEYGVALWHGVLLTESPSLSLVICWAYVHLVRLGAIRDLRAGRALDWTALLLDLALIAIRPIFFFLPLGWYGFLLMARRLGVRQGVFPRRILLHGTVVAAAMIAWCTMVWVRYGHFEISNIGRISRLGKAMALGYVNPDICHTRHCSYVVARGLAVMDSLRTRGPYAVLTKLSTEFDGISRDAMIDSLNGGISMPLSGVRRSWRQAFSILTERLWYNPHGALLRWRPYRAASRIVGNALAQLANYGVMWAAVFIGIMYRSRGRPDADLLVRLVFLFAIAYVATVSLVAGYEDMARLIVPIIVFVNALVVMMGADLLRGTFIRSGLASLAGSRAAWPAPAEGAALERRTAEPG